MVDFLRRVLGGKILVEDYKYREKTPSRFTERYKAQILQWKKQRCILLTPKTEYSAPPEHPFRSKWCMRSAMRGAVIPFNMVHGGRR